VPPKREDPEKAVLEVLWKPKSGIQGRRSFKNSATVSCSPLLFPVRFTTSVKEGFKMLGPWQLVCWNPIVGDVVSLFFYSRSFLRFFMNVCGSTASTSSP
jgi:hypothetical protein